MKYSPFVVASSLSISLGAALAIDWYHSWVGRASSQKGLLQSPAPVVLSFEPAVLELGDIGINTACELNADLWNRSDQPITVTKVVAPCSCTTVTMNPMHLAPGAAAKLTGFFRPGYTLGNAKRSITVHESSGTSVVLQLRATVIRQLQWTPAVVALEPDVSEQSGHASDFFFVNNSDAAVQLRLGLSNETPGLYVSPEKAAVEPGQFCRITVCCGSGFVSPSERTVMIHSNHPTEALLSVPVTIRPKSGIT